MGLRWDFITEVGLGGTWWDLVYKVGLDDESGTWVGLYNGSGTWWDLGGTWVDLATATTLKTLKSSPTYLELINSRHLQTKVSQFSVRASISIRS